MASLRSTDRPLSLGEQIANKLAEDILRERLLPGAAITEQHIAATFGVSRGPVREALRILEQEGVVQILPRRGARVTKLSVAELDEIFVIRSNLFGLAARLFTEHVQPADLARLNELLGQMERLGPDQVTEHATVSAEMSLVLLNQCGNARLRTMVLQLARQIARYTRLGLQTKERRQSSISSWRAMIQALSAGDATGAEQTAQRMVLNTRQEAIRQLEGGQNPPVNK